MNNVMIQDVCEVFIADLDQAGKQYFFGLTTKNSVTQKIKSENLKGGIGNGIVGVVNSDKEIAVKVSTLLHNDSIFEIQSGAEFENGTMTIHQNEVLTCTLAGTLTLTGTPLGSSVVCYDKVGAVIAGAYATSKFTSTAPTDIKVGDTFTVVYPASVTADILLLDSKKFPKNYAMELHTIAYDVDKNIVVADIYWTFNKVSSNGAINASYDAGKSNGDEIEFTALLLTGSTAYGSYVVVPRVIV